MIDSNMFQRLSEVDIMRCILLCTPTVKNSEFEQVWMTHLLNLVDVDSFQPLSDVPLLSCSGLPCFVATIWTK